MADPYDRSVGMGAANLWALVFGPGMVAPLIGLHALVHGPVGVTQAVEESFRHPLILLGVFTAGVVAHELVHGLGWMVAAGLPPREMTSGFNLRAMTPYAHCRRPIPARAYRVGGAAPGLLIGVLPAVGGSALGSGPLAAFGWLFTLIAGGDALVLRLLRGVPAAALCEDHPTRAGCRVHPSAEAS